MIKKCIVQYDELEKPIGLIELKEFSSTPELRQFLENCEKNKLLYKQRLENKAEKERVEKDLFNKRLSKLESENEFLKSVLCHILGYNELDERELGKLLEGETHEKE